MKLLELCRYGTYIAFAKEQDKICESFGLDYSLVVAEYEQSRNEGICRANHPELQQPVLYPFKDYIAGHCTIEDMEIMLSQVETPILKEAYKVGRGTTIWGNCNIYKTAKIGKGVSIGQFTEIGPGVVIGNGVRIGAHCFIPEGVTIEDDCFIAPRVSFSNDKRPPSKKECWGKILVKKGAAIGMGSIILPDVTIGEGALVGAGAVVTKDIPAWEKWYGVPAYSHGDRNG
jgi:acetyltransferase-like isoleucine patch superfamily enzyme